MALLMRCLGSARAPRAGDGALAIANFSPGNDERKVRFDESPKPARRGPSPSDWRTLEGACVLYIFLLLAI